MFFSVKNWVDHKEMFNSIIKISLVDQPSNSRSNYLSNLSFKLNNIRIVIICINNLVGSKKTEIFFFLILKRQHIESPLINPS
jgi:hypothetical protein